MTQHHPRLSIARSALETIKQTGVAGYPEEGCGLLIGEDRKEHRRILEARPAVNTRPDSRATRYTIEPRLVLETERELEGTSRSLVGYFHSHPDHPARPSQYDQEQAWPWYTYIIVAVERGMAREPKAFTLEEDRQTFTEVPFEEFAS